ncbi:MAG: DUF1217 domain-containing protein [Gemmobacter sp.]|uniref:DUF1217 domain-containing protein n=1 Tax=Gemmobacter sp. TaxID=1898957 RepID=UPI001A6283B5|nr:DUF1217 domain-containing protein [Gemmobacter sp.]MBL8561444.1 DUF1217 domain-containing protein [Gemmobacter sp.]
MTYSVTLPLSGYAGWNFLKRTQEKQQALLSQNTVQQRDEAYFREKIGSIDTAEELVADRRLLGVALGAFGLESDINNKFFIRKVLESSALEPKSLANKLSDKRYKEMAEAFGFGTFATPNTKLSTFADDMLSKYRQQTFETSVGEANGSLRIALYAERSLPELAAKNQSQATKWYTVIGSEPLRTMFQTVFNLPTAFGTLDVDQQVVTLQKKAKAMFGSASVDQFSDPAAMQKLLRNYIVRAEIANGSTSSTSKGASALQILQSAQSLSIRL